MGEAKIEWGAGGGYNLFERSKLEMAASLDACVCRGGEVDYETARRARPTSFSHWFLGRMGKRSTSSMVRAREELGCRPRLLALNGVGLGAKVLGRESITGPQLLTDAEPPKEVEGRQVLRV